MFSSRSNASQVFHLWANASKPSGKRGDGRVYFEGRKFYSFGTHYVAAYLMPDATAKAGTGQGHVALFNASKYSPTTSGHVAACRSAASHLTGYNVPELTSFVDKFERVDSRFYDPGEGRPSYREPTKAERKAKLRAATEGHVRSHWQEFAKGDWYGAAYILALGKVREPAKAFARIVKQETAKAKRKAAKAARDARLILIREAKSAADDSDASFREYVARLVSHSYVSRGRYNWRTQVHETDSVAGDLPRAMSHYWKYAQLGKAVLGVRRVAILRGRRAALKHASERFAAVKAAQERNRNKRAAARYVRQGFAELRKPGLGRFTTSSVYRIFAESLDTVSAFRLPAATASHLMDLAKAARTCRDTLATAEREAERIAAERRKAEREREMAARIEREAATRAAWFAGDSSVNWHGSDAEGRAFIRAIRVARDMSGTIVAGELQTSHGAEVPLLHAIRAFRFLKLCNFNRQTWHANGRTIRVGHFKIDWVKPDEFKAGCHRISWSECERVAMALGVFNVPADESPLEPSHVAA